VPPAFSLDARILAVRLGLGDLVRPEPCMGWANGCVCTDCLERDKTPTPEPAAAQPWEPRSLRAA
jgi:hypothetical protein